MNNSSGFPDFDLEAKARFWPGLSDMCHIRSTAVTPRGVWATRGKQWRGACRVDLVDFVRLRVRLVEEHVPHHP